MDNKDVRYVYALEISFEDSPSLPETLYLKRHAALISSTSKAHVVIEDFAQSGVEVYVSRGLGRKFFCEVRYPNKDPIRETYESSAKVSIGGVTLFFVALDSDLFPREGETLDRAGVRLMKLGTGTNTPKYPAVVVMQEPPIIVSLPHSGVLEIGRGKQSFLRLDPPDISSLHARVTFEHGDFFVEDLGSTNGTYLNDQQISGRIKVPSESQVQIGFETFIAGVTDDQELKRVAGISGTQVEIRSPTLQRASYPALVCLAEVARPGRVLIPRNTVVKVGRDPTSDMWIGAPHISRVHCSIQLLDDKFLIRDHSTNGTTIEKSVVRKGETFEAPLKNTVLELGGGVTIGVCISSEDEEIFRSSGGSRSIFVGSGQRSVVPEALASAVLARNNSNDEVDGPGGTSSRSISLSSSQLNLSPGDTHQEVERKVGSVSGRGFKANKVLFAVIASAVLVMSVLVVLLAPLVMK